MMTVHGKRSDKEEVHGFSEMLISIIKFIDLVLCTSLEGKEKYIHITHSIERNGLSVS